MRRSGRHRAVVVTDRAEVMLARLEDLIQRLQAAVKSLETHEDDPLWDEWDNEKGGEP